MLVHGALHLIGMDHGDDILATEMENAEVEALESLYTSASQISVDDPSAGQPFSGHFFSGRFFSGQGEV
jgi:hypothetical protein